MPEHVSDRVDFSGVRYANCWEDTDILCDALQPREGARILSIASAGDNAFALLAEGAEVVAADLSPAQLACVELRRAAFATLEYEELLIFLGVRKGDERQKTFERLSSKLSPEVKAYWVANSQAIDRGVVHAGKFENYFHLFSRRVIPWVHSRRRIEELVKPKDLKERFAFYEKTWNSWRWRMMFQMFFSRFVMGRLGRDPEFFRYVEGSVADRILERAKYALTELPTHDNHYLDYILFGHYREALPRYLRPEKFENIRQNLDKLTTFHGTIEQAAEAHGQAGFDGFNLSDIFEYLNPTQCEEVFRSLLKHSRKGTRFAYWNMLAPRQCPYALSDQIKPMQELSQELFARDKAFFYSRFVVEEVR